MTNPKPPSPEATESPAEGFQVSPRWVFVGVLAIAVGIGCGWIMSSATFLR